MSLATISAIGIGLAMDAVAVSTVSGLAKRRPSWRDAWSMALIFGLFQAVMPIIGFAIGVIGRHWIQAVDHWIAFILLGAIGAKMAWEGWHFHPDAPRGDPFGLKRMLIKGIATSIDALAVGVTLSVLELPIWASAGIIGLITVACCLPAVWLGARLGERWAARAEIFGGVLLIAMGTRILVEHLSV